MCDDKIVLNPTSINTILSIPDGKSHADDWLDAMVHLCRAITDGDFDMLMSTYDEGFEALKKEMEDKER